MRLISSKTKAAPLSRQTIPRLELMGATLVVHHVNHVEKVLSEDFAEYSMKATLWVDSYTVLCWIHNSKPWKQFIRNRVAQIHRLTNRGRWHHCPGTQNPADLPSHGLGGKDLAQNRLWREGPEFMTSDSSSWPTYLPSQNSKEHEAFCEIIKNPPEVTFTMLSKNVNNDSSIGNVGDIMRFSSKGKLIRKVAYVMKFIRWFRNSTQGIKKSTGELSAEDIQNAENIIIRSVQVDEFNSELTYLCHASASKDVRPTTLVTQFNLVVSKDGILRVKSRLEHASLTLDAIQPILLPRNHSYSRLVVRKYHERVFHNGLRETLSALRSRYWTLGGREVVKAYIRSCILCKKLEGLLFSTVQCLDLPAYRVDKGPPLSNVGLDLWGALVRMSR